jgi:predicted secreted hydrolase
MANVKALIATLLLIALAASAPFLMKEPEAPPVAPIDMSLLPALLQQDVEGFASADTPWRFSFPDDHAAHPDFRTELWQFSGSVSDRHGRHFGFQLTFFRIGVTPPATPIGDSAWATRDVYSAQFAVTDAADNRFHAFERFARAAMGLSGSSPSPLRVWVEDWMMEVRDGDGEEASFDLRAAQDGIGVELSLRSAKPAVIPTAGRAGPGGGSVPNTVHAYLMTRLIAHGTIRIGDRSFDVEGDAWLDRAWGLVPVPLGPVVWDRFSLQFEDGRELVSLRVRRRDGSGEPVVTAMLVERDGSTRVPAEPAPTIDVLAHWSSPYDGTRFPAEWRVSVPDEKLEVYLVPYVAAQDRRLSLRSWAGTVRINGTLNGRPIEGDGYVELAGYGQTTRRP